MNERTAGETGRIRRYYAGATWRASAGREYLVEERRRVLRRLVQEALGDLASLSICDVGCGNGSDLSMWAALGVPPSRLFGTELQPHRARAASAAVPGARVVTVDGFGIPVSDGSMDLVTATLVLSTVLDPVGRRQLLAEMRRVTRSGGVVAVYDFRVRKPWNRHVRPVRRGELVAALGRPSHDVPMAPFLPALDVALRMPAPIRAALTAILPRTHRLWVWTGS